MLSKQRKAIKNPEMLETFSKESINARRRQCNENKSALQYQQEEDEIKTLRLFHNNQDEALFGQ